MCHMFTSSPLINNCHVTDHNIIMADKEAKTAVVIGIFVFVGIIECSIASSSGHVLHFDSSDFSRDGVSILKHSVHKREAEQADPICVAQENNFLHNKKEGQIDKEVIYIWQWLEVRIRTPSLGG